jgi:NUMOD1 domain
MENMCLAANNIFKSPLAKLSTAQPNSIKVEVLDLETNIYTVYDAIKAAARALSIDRRYIEHYIYLTQNKPVLDRYIFKLINTNDKKIEKFKKLIKKSPPGRRPGGMRSY